MLDLIVHGGTVVTPSGSGKFDIGIQGEKIVLVAASGSISDECTTRVDASGKYVFPGGIEPHTHIATRVSEAWAGRSGVMTHSPEAASRAAAHGGVTTNKDIAGGKDGYEQLMNWASDNMSDADANSFDEVIETGNKAAVTFAVKALMGQYEDAVGRDSNLVQGKASDNSGDVYRSMAEVVRDMNNPEYDRDPAVRADVQRKLERSNLQV